MTSLQNQKINHRIVVIVVALFLLLFSIFTQPSYAQIVGDDIQMQSDPSSPNVGETVTVSITSSTVDLKRSNIQWFMNEILVLEGVGTVNYSFSTKSAGSRKNIEVVVISPDGLRYTKTKTYRIQDVDLVWAGHTYTPPLYKGLSLASPQGFIKVHALPTIIQNGRQLSPSELTYTWIVDGIVLGNQSGVGKDMVAIRGHNLNRGKVGISVTVTSLDKLDTASANLIVKNTRPEIGLYKLHPLERIQYVNAIGESYTQVNQEESLVIVPWYFSLDDLEKNSIEYRWEINNEKLIPHPSNPRIMTFRKSPESKGGAVRINIEVENIGKLMQYIKRNLTLNI